MIKDNNFDDSLHLAVLYKRKDILEKLLKLDNIDINSVNNIGESALHYACNFNENEIAEILIKSNINVNIKEYQNNFTALVYCINLNNNYLVKKLIPNSKINLQDSNGNSPLHHSIMTDNNEISNILIYLENIDFNLVNIEGDTPFHIFLNNETNYENIEILKVFTQRTNLNIQNSEGNTCLHLLFVNNLWTKIKNQLENKKNKYFIKNNKNEIILDYFKDNKSDYNNVLELIVNSYFRILNINDSKEIFWTNKWENLCKKNSDDNLIKLKDLVKSKKDNHTQICKDIIRDYIIKYNISFPISTEFKKIILDNGIYVDKCTYTGSPFDILIGNIYINNKYDFATTILTRNFTDNDSVSEYLNSLGENQGYKVEFLNFEIMWIYQKLFFPTDFENKVNKTLKDSNIKFIIISLAIELSNGSHANILIWDIKNKNISRFEPHGANNPNQFNYNENLLDDLLRNKFTCFDNSLEYIKPKEYLPIIGFQKFEMMENEKCTKIGDPNGFCAVWCVWWVDMRLKYANIDQKKLVKKLMDKIREDGIFFKDMIRNYSANITIIRDKILKSINIDVNDWYNDNYTDEQSENLINEINKMI